MKDQFSTFYLVSLVIAYFVISGPSFDFELWMVFVTPLFALWLSGPVLFSEEKTQGGVIIAYVIWVTVQCLIYYFGLGPPGGNSRF